MRGGATNDRGRFVRFAASHEFLEGGRNILKILDEQIGRKEEEPAG